MHINKLKSQNQFDDALFAVRAWVSGVIQLSLIASELGCFHREMKTSEPHPQE